MQYHVDVVGYIFFETKILAVLHFEKKNILMMKIYIQNTNCLENMNIFMTNGLTPN